MSVPRKVCGICYVHYVNLKQHLNVRHTILNQEERALLVKYGNAQTTDPVDCPICDKRSLVHLDKHVQLRHNIVETQERDEIVTQAKRLAIVKEFVELRNSSPWPPLVSTLGLDVEPGNEEDVDIWDTPGPRECSIPVAMDNTDKQSPRPLATSSTRPNSPSPAAVTSMMSISPVTVAPSSASVTDSKPGPSNFPSPHGHRDGSTMSEPFNPPVERPLSGGKDSNPACQWKCEELSRKVQVLERQILGLKRKWANEKMLTQESTPKRRDVTNTDQKRVCRRSLPFLSDRRKVTQSMRHDRKTAEKAYETRQLRIKALFLELKKGKLPPNVQSDESESFLSEKSSQVSGLGDQSHSGSSVSSEQVKVQRRRHRGSKKKVHLSSLEESPKKEAHPEIITPSKTEDEKKDQLQFPSQLSGSDDVSISGEIANPEAECHMASTSDSEPLWGTQEDSVHAQSEMADAS